MSRETGKQDKSRRDFLRGLAVVGGATAVAGTTGAEVAAPAPQAAPARAKGYRVTAHVAKYYRKARI